MNDKNVLRKWTEDNTMIESSASYPRDVGIEEVVIATSGLSPVNVENKGFSIDLIRGYGQHHVIFTAAHQSPFFIRVRVHFAQSHRHARGCLVKKMRLPYCFQLCFTGRLFV